MNSQRQKVALEKHVLWQTERNVMERICYNLCVHWERKNKPFFCGLGKIKTCALAK